MTLKASNLLRNLLNYRLSFSILTDFLEFLRDLKSITNDVHVEWICAVAGFLFTPGRENLLAKLSENNFSWKILSEGLTSADSLIKKQSLYLLKRWTDQLFRYLFSAIAFYL